MLPSRPNAGRGLPSRTPVRPRNNDYDDDDRPTRSGRSAAPSAASAPRSRSVGRPSGGDRNRNYDSDDYDRPSASSSSRTLKTQRSGANLRPDAYRDRDDGRSRSGKPQRPPLPSSDASRMSTYSAPDDARSGARRSDMSTSTTSSSGASSFLDRLRAGKSGETSSRTSLEEEYEPPKRSRAGAGAGAGRQPARRRGEDDDDYNDDRDRQRSRGGWAPKSRGGGRMDDDYEDVEAGPSEGQGHGSSLWNTVSSAASNLTINVSKAWETKVATYMGEETPPGSESRLTRAMKAYHLEKARSPADLPSWLFEESERRARAPASSASDRRRQDRTRGGRDRFDEEEEYEEVPQPKSRGLRDIYDRAAAKDPEPAPSRPQRSYGGSVDEGAGSGASGSKAANRLKALRDAKRAAATGPRYDEPQEEDNRYDEPPARSSGGRRGNRSEDLDARSTPPPRPRVGLPSGPARRY